MPQPFDSTPGAHVGTRHLDAPPVPAILKPLGATTPVLDLMPRNWTVGANLDHYRLITGPATRKRSPDITRPTWVVLHGVHYARAFAIGEMLDLPDWDNSHRYGDRWPWYFHVRIHIWVPDIEDGPRTSDLVTKRSLGRVQVGGEFAKLSTDEFERIRGALLQQPNVQER